MSDSERAKLEKQKQEIARAERELEQAWRDNADKLAQARAQAEEQANERAYKLEQESLEEYFDKKIALQEQGYQRERKAIEDQLVALEDLQSQATSEAERLRLEKQIQDLAIRTKQAEASGDLDVANRLREQTAEMQKKYESWMIHMVRQLMQKILLQKYLNYFRRRNEVLFISEEKVQLDMMLHARYSQFLAQKQS
jgi:DNA repair exonuclease SbcCD ATPase subunit